MKIGVLGTGSVGDAIASKLASLGHDVMMGSRTANNDKAVAWVAKQGGNAKAGTFADAAAHGEWIFVCTAGHGTLDALAAAGADRLRGKIVVDISNPLDFSKGMPPRLFTPQDDSLGEQVQRAHPEAKVVKTLNTINANVMVDPARVPGDHDVFVAGNDAGAKAEVTALLKELGWRCVLDLGGIESARVAEAHVLLWVKLWAIVGSPDFNIHVVRAT